MRVGETGVGWDKFWLGQCPSGPNESPDGETNDVFGDHVTTAFTGATRIIRLYRDVWIAAIASSRKSLATQTAAICIRFQERRVRHVYVTMHITLLTRKSALIY